MNKITIFEGKQGSGKTKKALEISKEKNPTWLFRNYGSNYNLKEVEEYTQLLIFDEIHHSDIQYIAQIANKDYITFRQPYGKQPITIKRPEILICTVSHHEELLQAFDKNVVVEIVNF